MKINSYDVYVDEDLVKIFEAFCNSFAEKIEINWRGAEEV
jgi:hypothetical protein